MPVRRCLRSNDGTLAALEQAPIQRANGLARLTGKMRVEVHVGSLVVPHVRLEKSIDFIRARFDRQRYIEAMRDPRLVPNVKLPRQKNATVNMASATPLTTCTVAAPRTRPLVAAVAMRAWPA